MPHEDSRPRGLILVVDDNEQNRELAEGHLLSAGYEVRLAEGGEQAIAEFQAHRPDLVLLDIFMPVMDGFATCARIRQLPGGADTPIVFLTAISDLAIHAKALESGADDFLTKPIQRTELMMRVRSLLRIKQLKDELKQRHDEIRAQHQALVRSQREKGELIGHLVHDLKNPLTSIIVSVGLLARDPALPEKVRKSARLIARGAGSLNTLVSNMLDINTHEDGALVPKKSQFDLSEVVQEVASFMEQRATELGYTLEAGMARGAQPVFADRDLIRRVIENLTDNAIKYTPAGTRIQLETMTSAGDVAELRVRDDGPGVPTASRARIFEKYAQLDDPDAPALRSGRGLGLAFCRLAVELHRGRIWVEDNAPRGACFCVQIPTRNT
jgi:two-component system, sensor histidine kinase and response regulator